MAVRVIISGRVQGVGYRAWTQKTAIKLGLHGWVRNRNEGTVEAVFCGDAIIVSQMLEACRKGPVLARVEKIEQFGSDESPEGFEQRPTA